MGILLLVLAVAHFALHGLAVKVLVTAYTISAPEIVYFSSILGLLAFYANASFKQQDILSATPPGMRGWLFYRVLFGCL